MPSRGILFLVVGPSGAGKDGHRWCAQRGRGRESAAEIAERLGRASALTAAGNDVRRIDNSATIAEGVAALVAAMRATPAPGSA
jgi:ribose 1,5-bisphosphokinase PhnN